MRLAHDEALAKLQNTMLEVLDAFAAFCEAHALPWFLAYGTALGAMRHDGFIPWDDDADVGMLRDDYDRFLALVDEEGFAPGYSVHNARNTANFDGVMTKVFKDGTTYLDRRAQGEGFEQAIFIDVFPYDRLLADPALSERQIKSTRLWQNVLYIRGSGDVRVPHGGALGATERLGCALANPVLRLLLSKDRALRGFDANIVGPEDAVGELWAQFPFPNRHPMGDLLPAVPHAFEDRVYPVPADPEAYLATIYGDWRQLPPVKNRRTHLPVLIDFGDGDVYEGEGDPAKG